MDIDFITNLETGFEIELGDNPQAVSGNRALVNRFEITFLTKTRQYLLGDSVVADNFGGDADKFINKPQVLNDPQSIAASVNMCIEQTVRSIKEDQSQPIPDTEKLDKAELLSIDIVEGIVNATIQVYPVETERFSDIQFSLPITRIGA